MEASAGGDIVSDELKDVLAIALPVVGLLVGAMVIYGPRAKIEGADEQMDLRNKISRQASVGGRKSR